MLLLVLGEALLRRGQFAVLHGDQLLLLLLQLLELGDAALEVLRLGLACREGFLRLGQFLLQHRTLASGTDAGLCARLGRIACAGRDDFQSRIGNARSLGRRSLCRLRDGRRRRIGRRHLGIGRLWRGAARCTPFLDLGMDDGIGLLRIQLGHRDTGRSTQYRARLETVDVAANERVRIRAQQRNHGLVERAWARNVRGDGGQRVAAAHFVVATIGQRARNRCRRRCHLRRRCDGLRRRGRGRDRLGVRLRAVAGCGFRLGLRGHGLGGLGRTLDDRGRFRRRCGNFRLQRRGHRAWRVDQRGVFTDQPALPPVDLDQEGQQGFVHRLLAGDPDHRIAAGIQRLGELKAGDNADGRTQANAGEGFRRSQAGLQLFQLGRIAADDRNLGHQRLADLRLDLDLAQPQRGRAKAGGDRQQRQYGSRDSFHDRPHANPLQ